ncbi:hypothetical protein, partial [Kitasatospora putterlickiae]
RPRLADGAVAEEVLTDIARLSEPYGTKVTAGGTGTGELVLDGP